MITYSVDKKWDNLQEGCNLTKIMMCEKAQNLIASSGSNEMGHHCCVLYRIGDNLLANHIIQQSSLEINYIAEWKRKQASKTTPPPNTEYAPMSWNCDCEHNEHSSIYKLYGFKDIHVKWVFFLHRSLKVKSSKPKTNDNALSFFLNFFWGVAVIRIMIRSI